MPRSRKSALGIDTSMDSVNSFENMRDFFNVQGGAHKLSNKVKYRYSYRRRILGKTIEQALKELIVEANKALTSSLHQEYEKVLICAICEFQLRLVQEYELQMSEICYDSMIFWQEQLKRPTMAWIEGGPFNWFKNRKPRTHIEDSIEFLQVVLATKLHYCGLLQQHLTRKTVNTEILYLDMWNSEAITLIEAIFTEEDDLNDSQSYFHPLGSPIDKKVTLKSCIDSATKLQKRLKSRFKEFKAQINDYKMPSWSRRRWLAIVIATPFIYYAAKWVYQNRDNIPIWRRDMKLKFNKFYTEHVTEPTKGIIRELLYNERTSLTDQIALEDTKLSLRKMIHDFYKDTYPEMSIESRKQYAKNMDMSLVSAIYEESIINSFKGLMSGELLRMLLIQVQFLKKEMLTAMHGMDELMEANEFNARFAATFPAIAALYLMWLTAKKIIYSLQRKQSRYETANLLRSHLLSMERMLNIKNVSATEEDVKFQKLYRNDLKFISSPKKKLNLKREWSEETDNFDFYGDELTSPAMPVIFLQPNDLGTLILLCDLLWNAASMHTMMFSEVEKRNLEEDLWELKGDCGPVTITQQISIVQRMFRSYRFLQAQPYSIFNNII